MSENESRQDPFLDELVEDLEPVRPLPPLIFRLFSVLVPAFIIAVGGSFGLGWEKVMEYRMSHWSFWLQQGLLLLAGVSAAYGALAISVPGRMTQSKKWPPIIFVALWSSLLFLLLFQWAMNHNETSADLHPTIFCPTVLATMAIPTALIIARLVLKGAIFDNMWAAFFVGLSAASLASFGLQMTCHVGHPAHLVLFHYLPAVALTLLAFFIGRKFLIWKS